MEDYRTGVIRCDEASPELHGGGSRWSRCELGLGRGEMRDSRQMRKKGWREVFMAGGWNHPFEIYGLRMRDVPHSTDMIMIKEIVGTWQLFPAEISSREREDERFEGHNAENE